MIKLEEGQRWFYPPANRVYELVQIKDDLALLRSLVPSEHSRQVPVDSLRAGDGGWKLAPPEPDPDNDDWLDFLHWLAGRTRDPFEIVRCVEKPHKYTTDYIEYLDQGGVNRR